MTEGSPAPSSQAEPPRSDAQAATVTGLSLAIALLVTVLAVPGTGCSTPDPGPPVPDSIMVSVIADLHLAGARQRLDPAGRSVTRDSVLAEHGLDSTRFAAASAWLREHPDAFVALYGAVVDRLNANRTP